MKDLAPANHGKFTNPHTTADGAPRARVSLKNPQTLWFNTGTLCNIECANCYIDSSPTNDALVYLTADEVGAFLDQARARAWPLQEIAFTGGEPFMNPQMIDMARRALTDGFRVLILTNAMRPMMRKPMQDGLIALNRAFPDQLCLRVSLDHFGADLHDAERGAGSFDITLRGMRWLAAQGIPMAAAGRAHMAQSEAEARDGFARLFARHGFDIDANDPARMVLFPEMDLGQDVPEITTDCWDILGKSPQSVMCASARMVVKRKGAAAPSVVACTLLPYETEFDLGATLADAEGDVALNHPHCAKFCVLGGASCSA